MSIQLFQDDCMELMKQLPDKSIDLVVTDPPYEIETKGAGLYKQDSLRYVKSLESIANGFSTEILDELCRVMRKINIYIFCSQRQIPQLLNYFHLQRNCNWNLITWHKTNPVPACGNKYLTDTEYILFFREKGVKVYGSYETKKTWYLTPHNTLDKKKYGHPTIKPVEIVTNLITNSSLQGDTIIDPFMGSGTTGVACIDTERNFVGYEVNQEYFEVATRRIRSAELDKLLEEGGD